MNILGIGIDESSRDEIHARVDGFLRENRFHRIATVNPEFLVEADRNPAFHDALSAADFRIADGMGIVLAGLFRGRRITRYPGADLLLHILAKAEREHIPVFLAVREDGLSEYKEVQQAIFKRYPNIEVSGENVDIADCRSQIADFGSRNLQSKILNHQCVILFCNFGAPKQELFLESFRDDPGSIRLAMGVGGAFDFLTEKRRRAPLFLRAIGLEWLWRLASILVPCENPDTAYPKSKRVRRIWNATVVFLWKILFGK